MLCVNARAACDQCRGPFAHIGWTSCGRIRPYFVLAAYIPCMPQPKERNDRLAEAMARAGLTSGDLAASVDVDPRTVDRLIADRARVPRAHARHAIAEAVQVPVGMLWPSVSSSGQTTEVEAIYPSRAAMPSGLVMSLLTAAAAQVDILTFAGMWLWDTVAGFGTTLAAKAQNGVSVRVCLGDPAGDAVRIRGAEEGIDDLLAARCRLAGKYAAQALTGRRQSYERMTPLCTRQCFAATTNCSSTGTSLERPRRSHPSSKYGAPALMDWQSEPSRRSSACGTALSLRTDRPTHSPKPRRPFRRPRARSRHSTVPLQTHATR